MRDEDKTDKTVERQVTRLLSAIATGNDHTAHAVYADNVAEPQRLGDGDRLVLEVMPEADGKVGPHDRYSLTLTNGFKTFYLAADSSHPRADVFFTLEETVTKFPDMDWYPLL